MKVTSTKSVHFGKLDWGINAGEERELPEDQAAQKEILEHYAIKRVGESASQSRRMAAHQDDSKS